MHRLLFLLSFACGCSSVFGSGSPQVKSHDTAAAGALVQRLNVTLVRMAPVTVEYWAGDEPHLLVDSPRATTHAISLTRLHAGRMYTYRIAGTEVTGSFTTDELPSDLARVQLTATGWSTTPLVLLHLFDLQGFSGYVAVDGGGEVVWYWRTLDLAFGADRRANGNAVFMDRARGLVEVRPDGSVAHELPQDRTDREQHHDLIVTPANTVLFLAFDRRSHASTSLKGEAVWEWTPETGRVERRWTSWDHLSPDRDRGPRFGEEWLHANSLAIGPRGNVLVSLHFLNQVLSLSPDFQRVEWRLGGVNATRTPGAADQYSGQHTAREIAPGRVLVFDNGFNVRDSSRAIELDLRGTDVRPVWQWQPARPNRAPAVGSARRLPGGNTLVAFGMSKGRAATGPIEVYEVDAAGQTVWHLELENAFQMYRAEPWPSIGSERVRTGRSPDP